MSATATVKRVFRRIPVQRSVLFLLVLILASAPYCLGGIYTLPTTLRGSVDPDGAWATGGAGTSTGNFLTGWQGGDLGPELRSVFVFDLSAVAGTVTAASLQLKSDFDYGYLSFDPTETFSIFDYLLDPAALSASNPGVATYTDAGSGTIYGSRALSDADENSLVAFVLNADGIAAVNAALGGKVAMGGALTTLTKGINAERVFGSSGDEIAQLVVTTADQGVPEPLAMVLTGTGLVLLILRRRAA
jgi:hypothetical protein